MDPRYFEPGKTAYVSQAAEEIKTIKSGAGKAYTIDVVNVTGADRFLYVFDNTTNSGTLLLPPFWIPTKGFISVQYEAPIEGATGFTIAASTTQATYVASGGGNDFMMRVVSK